MSLLTQLDSFSFSFPDGVPAHAQGVTIDSITDKIYPEFTAGRQLDGMFNEVMDPAAARRWRRSKKYNGTMTHIETPGQRIPEHQPDSDYTWTTPIRRSDIMSELIEVLISSPGAWESWVMEAMQTAGEFYDQWQITRGIWRYLSVAATYDTTGNVLSTTNQQLSPTTILQMRDAMYSAHVSKNRSDYILYMSTNAYSAMLNFEVFTRADYIGTGKFSNSWFEPWLQMEIRVPSNFQNLFAALDDTVTTAPTSPTWMFMLYTPSTASHLRNGIETKVWEKPEEDSWKFKYTFDADHVMIKPKALIGQRVTLNASPTWQTA